MHVFIFNYQYILKATCKSIITNVFGKITAMYLTLNELESALSQSKEQHCYFF